MPGTSTRSRRLLCGGDLARAARCVGIRSVGRALATSFPARQKKKKAAGLTKIASSKCLWTAGRQLNQIRTRRPYDGKSTFPSHRSVRPGFTAVPRAPARSHGVATPLAGTNARSASANRTDGTPMAGPPQLRGSKGGVHARRLRDRQGRGQRTSSGRTSTSAARFLRILQFAGPPGIVSSCRPREADQRVHKTRTISSIRTTILGVLNPRPRIFGEHGSDAACAGQRTRHRAGHHEPVPAVGQTPPFAGRSRPAVRPQEVSLTDPDGVRLAILCPSPRTYPRAQLHRRGP